MALYVSLVKPIKLYTTIMENTKKLTTVLVDDNNVEMYVIYHVTQTADRFEKDEDDITIPLDCTYTIDSISDIMIVVGGVEVSIANTLLKNSAMVDKIEETLLVNIEEYWND